MVSVTTRQLKVRKQPDIMQISWMPSKEIYKGNKHRPASGESATKNSKYNASYHLLVGFNVFLQQENTMLNCRHEP